MNRILILPLVLALSGLPAAAVVCDLILCVEVANVAAAQAACHVHAAPESGTRISPQEGDCTHLAPADPAVASVSLRLVQLATVAPPVNPATDAVAIPLWSFGRSPSHGPPRALRIGSSRPLRI